VVEPLAAVHRKGLVHRDLKPNNIMIQSDGQALLIDFGLAAWASGGQAQAAVGTLAYSPPEQTGMLKRPVDHRSDLYSLGIVLFESLAGALPFAANDVGDLLRMHAVTPPPDLVQVVPGIPIGLAALVARLLAKDPDDRYQSGEELAGDLRRLQADPHAPLAPPGAAGLLDVRSRPPLCGRARELALLRSRWETAREGRGRVCVIRGAGGGGKSRLAAELAGLVADQGSTVLHGKSSADDPVPMAPLRAAFETYLEGVGRLPPQDRGRVHDLVRGAAGSRAGLLSALTPALGALLGVSHPADGQDQFTLAVVTFLTDLARESGGLLLFLDDVQWLDAGTARVLTQLSALLDGVPMMVLATARNDAESAADTDAVVGCLGSAVDLDLELTPLNESGVAELVQSLLPGMDTGPLLGPLLTVRGNGNPFVVQEYLRAIVDAGLLSPSWGSWQLDQQALDALELPQDALGLVLTRVRGLGSGVRELLVTAAAVGARFRPQVVADVHGIDVAVVLAALIEAAGHRLVELREGGEFAFLHDRIREALNDELDAVGSARLHQRIAEALEAMPAPTGRHAADHTYAVAHHYVAGEPGTAPARAFAACWRAGQRALDAYAPADAVAFLQHAADLGGTKDSRFLLTFGTALIQNGQYRLAREQLEHALAVEREPLPRAQILTMLAHVHRAQWRTAETVAAVEQGLRELGAPLPRNRLLLALSTAVMFAAAQLMQWSGYRLGSARGRERERCTLIAGLHEVGAYMALLSMTSLEVMVYNVRALYWVNRIGAGTQYARSQGAFGFLAQFLGLRRVARRAFARVAADDSAGSVPSIRGLMALYRGAAMFLGYHDNGEVMIRSLQEHGPSLDLASYCDGLCTFVTTAVFEGRSHEAAHWLALAERRLALRPGEVTAMIFASSQVSAVMGRPVEATAAFRRAEEVLEDNTARAMTVLRMVTWLILLSEQNEIGEPFDRAASEFESLGLTPSIMLRGHRPVLFAIAMGRLAQCRSAPVDERRARLRAARTAVDAIRTAPRSQTLAAFGRIAHADLLVVEGAPRKALAVLAGTQTVHHPDAPLLAFELARVRARALMALDGLDEGRRQAHQAWAIAQANDWPHRASWITAEFELGPECRPPRGTPLSPSRSTSSPSTSPAVGVERQRLAALEQVSAAASRVLDPGALARITLDETIRILAADRAFLFLAGADGHLRPHLGRDASGRDVTELTGYSATLVERVHQSREPLVVTGTEEGAALGAQSVVLHGLRSIMVAPLQMEGRLLGVVYLDSQVAKGIFTADDAGILIALTHHIAASLETARAAQLEISVQTAQRQRDLADTLREALGAMAATMQPQQVLARLLSWAVRMVGGDDGWVLTDDGASCTLATVDGDGELLTQAVDRDPALAALIGSEDPVVGSPTTAPPPLRGRRSAATSWIALPLRSGDASLGVLVLASRTPDARLEEQVEVASALVAQGMTAYDRADLFAQVQSLAVADELTGIANRRHFFAVAERDVATAVRAERTLLAMMVDIDHFKAVNDTFGHPTGDDVIRVVAHRLAGVIRRTDLIGRYGGEEFAVILLDADPLSDLPEQLRACIADVPVPTRSGPLDLTVSIGIAQLGPDDADVAALLGRADHALYRAKQDGRNCLRTA
jgi:diguanylate cyclase (GGDEF)-like protein